MIRFSLRLVLALCLVGLTPLSGAGESTSTSYRLKQNTINTGGAAASSASYALNASAAQPATIGTSSSPGYVLQSGFWSFVGSGLVPVLLTVDKNAVMPSNVDLSWSGNNSPYDVYESTNCTSVFSGFIAQTPSNNYDDVTPPAGTVVCYNVLATAPGPAPPPN